MGYQSLPIVHLGLVFKTSNPEFNFSITGQATASLTISSGVELSKEEKYDFPPFFSSPYPHPIGPITPELTFYVGVDGNLHVGVSTGIRTR